jgi:hypothetical protein
MTMAVAHFQRRRSADVSYLGGYGESVSNLHRDLPDMDAPTPSGADAVQVVRTLRRSGPLRLVDLGSEPELLDWSTSRVERAVVSAWSRNLIFVDTSDLLVAI